MTKLNRYYDVMTNQKINLIIGSFTLALLLLGIISLINPLIYMWGGPIIIVTSITVLCCSYYFVWKAFHQSGKRLAQRITIPNLAEERKRHKGEQKLVNKLLILIGCYLAAFVPSIIFITMVFIQKFLPDYVSQEVAKYVNVIAIYIALSNSCCNPFIYIWKDAKFRTACKRLLQNRGVIPSKNNTEVQTSKV